jgi:spermidine synthase
MIHIAETSESDTLTSFPITSIVWSGKTRYCDSVIIADTPTYGRTLFLDGQIQSAAADERIYHESLVHPVMASCRPSRVLVVGGGEGATVREVLRWSCVQEVVWVDIDVELVELCKEHLGWAPHVYDNPRVKFIGKDIREVMPFSTLGTFDAIILDLPDPDDESVLYSPAMWAMYKAALTDSTSHIVTHVGPVRPFGNIGDGLQRVWKSASEGGFQPWVNGFYEITIPSFQGSWGFWIDGMNPLVASRDVVLPMSLNVVDTEQMMHWAYKTKVWRTILNAQCKNSYAGGSCLTYMPHLCHCAVETENDD